MKKLTKMLLAGALACAIPGIVSADPTVTMQLTAPPAGPSLGGVYISPYTALIGPAGETANPSTGLITGVSTPVICDDFTTDVSTATPPWQATVTNLASLQGEATANTALKFDTGNAANQQTDYTVAALLATEIMQAQSNGQTQAEADLSFALWGLFDPNSLDPNGPLSGHWVTGGDLTNAINDLAAAQTYVATNNLTPSNYGNVTIYSPNPKSASQEYIVVHTPEPDTLALLGIGLLGVIVLTKKRFGTTQAELLS